MIAILTDHIYFTDIIGQRKLGYPIDVRQFSRGEIVEVERDHEGYVWLKSYKSGRRRKVGYVKFFRSHEEAHPLVALAAQAE